MFSIYDQLPRYLLGKQQLTATVMCTVLFSLAFMLFSIPFSDNAWFRLGHDQAFLFTLTFFLMAALTVCISKKAMYSRRSDLSFTYLKYIVWDLAEAVAISVLYAFFTVEGNKFGILAEKQDFETLFLSALLYTSISLGVPYVVMAQYFALEEKNNTIRVLNYGNVVTDEELQPHEASRITLFDNNGVLKFSIHPENLYYIESDDNYIKVWYSDAAGETKQYMLRCRLKTIEDSFTEAGLVRCHRKYVVNISRVAVLKSEKDGYVVHLDIPGSEPIPVSKTYEQAVLARFNSR